MDKINYQNLAELQQAISEFEHFLNFNNKLDQRFLIVDLNHSLIGKTKTLLSDEYINDNLKLQQDYLKNLIELLKKEFTKKGGVL